MAQYKGVRPKGRGIEIRWSVKGQRHSEYLNQTPNQTNLQNAARYRKRCIEQCQRGEYRQTLTCPTFEQCCNLMLTDKAQHVKQSTLDSYAGLLSRHWSSLAPHPIDTISLRDLRAIDRETDWPHPKTRNNAVSALRQVFRYAFYEDMIDVDVSLKLRPVKYQKKEIDSFSPEEQAAILNALHGRFRLFYLLMFENGLRTGEVQALQWSDWSGDRLRVQRSMYRGQETSTKTHQARTVLLSPATVSALKAQQGERFLSRYIIHHNGQAYTTDRTLSQVFKRACEQAGVRHRRPYYCRHTYVTRALERGESVISVARQIGDRLETMQRNYADVMSGENGGIKTEKAT